MTQGGDSRFSSIARGWNPAAVATHVVRMTMSARIRHSSKPTRPRGGNVMQARAPVDAAIDAHAGVPATRTSRLAVIALMHAYRRGQRLGSGPCHSG
jgi:hypothetical protein